MASLKIRLRFNPGRGGSPMDKLGEFQSQMERFLRLLARDLGVDAKKGKWIASNFTNDSVAFDSVFSEIMEPETRVRGNRTLRLIVGESPMEACNQGLVSLQTVSEFSKVHKTLDPDEHFLVGLYDADDDDVVNPDWHSVTYRRLGELAQFLDAAFITDGSLQGVIHAWNFGGKDKFFTLRDLASNVLVRCEYPEKLHKKVHDATKVTTAVILVYGAIQWDKVSNEPQKVNVEDVEAGGFLSPAEFDRIFGSMPDYTGDDSTETALAWLRDSDH